MRTLARSFTAALLGLILTLAGLGLLPAHAAQAALFAFGDSLAAGDGSGPATGFPNNRGSYNEILAARNGWAVHNFAVSGARTTDVLQSQLPQAVATGVQPAVVTVHVGANDVRYAECLLTLVTGGANPCEGPEFVANLTAMGTNLAAVLGTVKATWPTAKVVVLGYFNPMPAPVQSTAQVCRAMTSLYLSKLVIGAQGQSPADLIALASSLDLNAVLALQAQVYSSTGAAVAAINQAVATVAAATATPLVGIDASGHDFCRDYRGRHSGKAWVLAPKLVSSLTVTAGSLSISISRADVPRHRCLAGTVCNRTRTPDLVMPAAWSSGGSTVRYTLKMWLNSFPHLSHAGNKAVARLLADALTPPA